MEASALRVPKFKLFCKTNDRTKKRRVVVRYCSSFLLEEVPYVVSVRVRSNVFLLWVSSLRLDVWSMLISFLQLVREY